MHTYTHAHMHTCTHACVHPCMRACMHARTHTQTGRQTGQDMIWHDRHTYLLSFLLFTYLLTDLLTSFLTSFLTYFLTSLLSYFLTYLLTRTRLRPVPMSMLGLRAETQKTRLNLTLEMSVVEISRVAASKHVLMNFDVHEEFATQEERFIGWCRCRLTVQTGCTVNCRKNSQSAAIHLAFKEDVILASIRTPQCTVQRNALRVGRRTKKKSEK